MKHTPKTVILPHTQHLAHSLHSEVLGERWKDVSNFLEDFARLDVTVSNEQILFRRLC